MTPSGKFVMRFGGGGGPVLFVVAALLIGGIIVAIMSGGAGHNSTSDKITALVIYGAVMAYVAYFLSSQKVEIEDGRVKVSFIFESVLPVRWSMEVDDIYEVVLASISQVRSERQDLLKDERIARLLASYDTVNATTMTRRLTLHRIPFIIVRSRHEGQSQLIATQVFRGKDMKTLFAELRSRGIKVSGDEGL